MNTTVTTRIFQKVKKNTPALFTPINEREEIGSSTPKRTEDIVSDETHFISRMSWIFCLLAFCGIAAVIHCGLASVQSTVQHEARIDASVYGSLYSLKDLFESLSDVKNDESAWFGNPTRKDAISDNIRVLTQKSSILAYFIRQDLNDLSVDPAMMDLEFSVRNLLWANFNSRDNIVEEETKLAYDVMKRAKYMRAKETLFPTNLTIIYTNSETGEVEDPRHSILRRNIRLTAANFGVGSLHKEIFDYMTCIHGKVFGIVSGLIMGPILSSHLNVINFMYKTITADDRQNLGISFARFLFSDSIFLLPNLIWMCMLIHLAPLVSPLVFIIGHYTDREIYAIGRSSNIKLRIRVFRYKVMNAIKRASRRLKNIVLGITYVMIATATIGTVMILIRHLNVSTHVKITYTISSSKVKILHLGWDVRPHLSFMREISMTPAEFWDRTDLYSERINSYGITYFDTYEAVMIRMILSMIACFVMYMTLPPVKDSTQRRTMIGKFFTTAGSFLKAHTFLVSCPKLRHESVKEHHQRRDGAWSQMITFFRVTLLTINAFPYIKDLLPVSGGEAGGIVDLVTCVILAYAAVRTIGNLYEIRKTQAMFWVLVFTGVLLARNETAKDGVIEYTSDLLGFPKPMYHGNLFPIAGHARMERGLLAYIFDLTDFKTMSHRN